jgi:hypothetical protein
MTHKEWEEIFYEQQKRERLRKCGISEDLVIDI